MSDPFDHPEMKAFMARAKREMFPKMKESTLSLVIAGEPDPKLCLELGAAILMDKPIIVVVPDGRPISASLKRVASAIVETSMSDPSAQRKIQAAVEGVLKNDQRRPS